MNGLNIINYINSMKKSALVLAVIFAAVFILGFWQCEYIFRFFTKPVEGITNENIKLATLWLTEAFISNIKLSALLSLIVITPFVTFYFYYYILKYLNFSYSILIKYFLITLLFFASGVAFDYFIAFPESFKFFVSYTDKIGVQGMYSISMYISFFLKSMLIFGILFELPFISYVFARLGILKAKTMSRYRKHAYLAVIIFSAVFTPASVISLIIMALPLLLVYELSFIVVRFSSKEAKAAVKKVKAPDIFD